MTDLEKATIAAQCAALLCQDLKALVVTDNLILSDVAVKELEIAAAQRIRLERLAANLKQMSGDANCFDLIEHLQRQQDFSLRTFGPGKRSNGLIDHIGKELREIAANPHDVEELVDVVLLALDGAWRAGYAPKEVCAAMQTKLEINMARNWPDWRTAEPGKAIEHVREADGSKFEGRPGAL